MIGCGHFMLAERSRSQENVRPQLIIPPVPVVQLC